MRYAEHYPYSLLYPLGGKYIGKCERPKLDYEYFAKNNFKISNFTKKVALLI